MRILRVVVLAALVLVALTTTARAQGLFLGSNLGLYWYQNEDGDALTSLSWPGTASLGAFQPGLRLGWSLDPAHRQAVYVDTGLSFTSIEGDDHSTTFLQLSGNYQYAFSDAAAAPFVNVGLGLHHMAYEGESLTPFVLGAGVGIRRMLEHGHGALRAEVRLDRQLEAERERGSFTLHSPALTGFTVRFGYDLFMK